MRVKSLAVAVGLSVVGAMALGQGISSASRGSSDPVTAPQIELPAEPVEEAPAPAPEVTPTPAVEETPAPAVEEEPPAPVTTTTTLPPAPAPAPVAKPVAPAAPAPKVVERVPVVPVEPEAAPAPAPAPKPDDPCHMDSYESRNVADLSGGERARAEKVDRNGNGTVCRKDIPGKGHGNTGQNSNIKDDQAR